MKLIVDLNLIQGGRILVTGMAFNHSPEFIPISEQSSRSRGFPLMFRYILKLFRDHVFHSVGVDGSPVLDFSHVLTCLNKVRHSAARG
jgi:hypothetical protein